MIRYFKCFLIFLLGVLSAQASLTLVKLDSGEQLVGEMLPRSTDVLVVLRSSLLGEVEVPRARVLSIQTKVSEPDVAVAEAEAAPAQASEPKATDKKSEGEVSPEKNKSASSDDADALSQQQQVVKTLREFKAPEIWSGNLRMGINLSTGDNKWTESYARGKLEIRPKGSPHFFRFVGSYTYRESERRSGEKFKSTDRYDGEFTYRRNFGEGAWFFQNALGGRVDQIKGIQHEVQDTIGIGYRYKPSDKFEFLIGGGGGVEELETSFDDTRAGFNTVVNLFQEATWRPVDRTSLVQRFNYYTNPEDSEQYNYVLTTAVRVRLTDLLGFEFSFNKNFDNDVGDGNARDDTQWRNALVVYF